VAKPGEFDFRIERESRKRLRLVSCRRSLDTTFAALSLLYRVLQRSDRCSSAQFRRRLGAGCPQRTTNFACLHFTSTLTPRDFCSNAVPCHSSLFYAEFLTVTRSQSPSLLRISLHLRQYKSADSPYPPFRLSSTCPRPAILSIRSFSGAWRPSASPILDLFLLDLA